MVWVFIAAAAVFIPIGIAVLRNPEGWSSAIRSLQQRYLSPWARPSDQIDDRDIFGNDKASSRALSMRITGIVFIVVPIAAVLTAIFTRYSMPETSPMPASETASESRLAPARRVAGHLVAPSHLQRSGTTGKRACILRPDV